MASIKANCHVMASVEDGKANTLQCRTAHLFGKAKYRVKRKDRNFPSFIYGSARLEIL
jgi:hypothetical protein